MALASRYNVADRARGVTLAVATLDKLGETLGLTTKVVSQTYADLTLQLQAGLINQRYRATVTRPGARKGRLRVIADLYVLSPIGGTHERGPR